MNFFNKNKNTLTSIGFGLIVLGFLSLLLSLVGLKFAFLAWMDEPSRLFGFTLRLVMVLSGFVLVYLAQTNYEGEDG
ncbi:MAG: hypothetical protein IPH16_22300 [Haliscomenobacter sp.]|nr:hypothetical protein [Haliscomenobacter sp.]MBK8879140.1 hypothetical protein [Haliscomenobacter sp.]